MSGWVAGAVVVGSVAGGYLASEGAKDAAQTSADASGRAAQLQHEQYLQDRQDLSPYREVAVGEEIYSNYNDDRLQAWRDIEASGGDWQSDKKAMADWDRANPEASYTPKLTGYTGGALNTLADYGTSQVAPGDYIPESDIPEYQRSVIGDMPDVQGDIPQYDVQGNIPQFDVQGDIPEFDSTQFDIYKDPSYEWRKEEMLRGLDRTSGATGKITSGNRMDEIMTRTGDMASQEYGAARDRMVQDYDIRRQNESSQYGRDVKSYDYGRQNEATQFGRDLTGYDANRANALTQYGFDTDAYNRAYGRDTDQYGRDLTAFNADTSRESQLYGRGVDDYGRAYSQEGDYLNRLAALSKTGQTAVNTGVNAGATYTTNAGQALQAAGNAQAAGIIGRSNAYGNTLADISQAGGYAMQQYQMQNQPQYADPWVSNDPSVWGQ